MKNKQVFLGLGILIYDWSGCSPQASTSLGVVALPCHIAVIAYLAGILYSFNFG